LQASLKGIEKRVNLIDSKDRVQVHLGGEMVVRANRFRRGLNKDLQLVAQVVRVEVVVLRAIVRVQFIMHFIARLFHVEIVLYVSTIKEAIPVQSVIG